MIIIDYKDRRPIYEQIVERFQMLIVKGILEPDSQMPSVRKLATDLAINPNTIQKAYTILEQNGFIYPVKGRGNFVTGGDKLVRQKQEAFLQNFREQARQAKELGITADALREEIRGVYAECDAGRTAETAHTDYDVGRAADAPHTDYDGGHKAESWHAGMTGGRAEETAHTDYDAGHKTESWHAGMTGGRAENAPHTEAAGESGADAAGGEERT